MAKLKAPLLSLGASGAIGKSLVFFGWKGIDAVREYVVPSNPQTTLQTTQRNILKAAVSKIHELQARATTPLNEDDQIAYSRWASIMASPRTWFNQAVKNWTDVKVAGKGPIIYFDGKETQTTATDARMRIYTGEEVVDTLVAANCHLGKTKTNLYKVKPFTVIAGFEMVIGAGDQFTDLVVGEKYYWQARPVAEDPAEGAYSGIYSFVATA